MTAAMVSAKKGAEPKSETKVDSSPENGLGSFSKSDWRADGIAEAGKHSSSLIDRLEDGILSGIRSPITERALLGAIYKNIGNELDGYILHPKTLKQPDAAQKMEKLSNDIDLLYQKGIISKEEHDRTSEMLARLQARIFAKEDFKRPSGNQPMSAAESNYQLLLDTKAALENIEKKVVVSMPNFIKAVSAGPLNRPEKQ